MNPRILGYGILTYAALTAGKLLGLAGFISGQSDDGWWAFAGAVLWLAFVTGSFGLILDRAWSRLLILIVAAASIGMDIAGLVLFMQVNQPLTLQTIVPVLLMTMPSVAIFAGALSLPAAAAWPVQAVSGPLRKPLAFSRIGFAYACFAWLAFVPWIDAIGSLLPFGHDIGQLLVMLLSIPVVIGTLVAGLAAIILSIQERREWPLLIMSIIVACMLLLFIAVGEWKIVSRANAAVGYAICSGVLAFFCIRWFAFIRRKNQ